MESLAPRHLKVLELYALGFTRADVAAKLHYSPITVKNYLSDACDILGARNSMHAVTICFARGYLCVDHRSERVYVPRPIDEPQDKNNDFLS